MANRNKRINILAAVQADRLHNGLVSAGDVLDEEGDILDGVKPSIWSPQGSEKTERSFLIDEGEQWRNIPYNVFNIMQAAEVKPAEVAAIMMEKVPETDEKFDLLDMEPGTKEFYVELAEILVYLSMDRDEEYGERYWYYPWRKAKERHPDLLGQGRKVTHPGKNATRDEEPDVSEETSSAAEAGW